MKKINFSFGGFVRAFNKTAAVLLVSVFASQCFAQSSTTDKDSERRKYIAMINEVMNFVEQNYVDEVDPKVLYEGAMKGMMNALDDPYTSYLDKETIRDLSDTTQGKFGGVGLQITKPSESTPSKPAYVEVSSPIEDSPGAKAGILSGDLLIEIEGESTAPMTMEEVLGKLRGEVGKPVKVKVLRGKNMFFEVTLVRAMIEVPTVKFTAIGKYGYLRIIQFTPETPGRVQEALDDFNKKGISALIIDLRDNPGGLISSVYEIADKFIDDGPIVSTKSRLSFENSVYSASPDKTVFKNKPIVVLINHGSASASEILSGALKDNHLAYLVGQRSYGKGSVQQIIPLSKTEEIKMTMARYYTPSDTNIDKIGIPPDLEVLYPETTEEEGRAYADLMKADVIEEYVNSHPDMTEADIKAYAAELKKTYNLDESLIRRLIRIRVWKNDSGHLYDLDYDIQLKAALKVLDETKDFKALVSQTKTLKELQVESEAKAKAEKNPEKAE